MHQVQIFEDLLFQSSRYWRCSRRIERWRQRQSQYCWDQQKSVRILLYVSSDLSDDQNNLLWRQCKHIKEVWIKQTFLTTLASHCHWSTPSYRWPSPPSQPCLPPSTSPSPSFAGVLAPPCLCRLLCPVKKKMTTWVDHGPGMETIESHNWLSSTFWQNCSVRFSTVAALPPRNPSFRTLRNISRYFSRMALHVFTWKSVNLDVKKSPELAERTCKPWACQSNTPQQGFCQSLPLASLPDGSANTVEQNL